jgi:hypothetical protein
MAKALTTNDPRLIRFTELKQELERANRRKTAFDSEIYNTRQRRASAKSEIEHYTKRLAETKLDIKQRIPTAGDQFKGTVGKTAFDNRPDFGVALFDRLEELEKKGLLGGAVRIAEVGGFPIYAQVRKGNLDASTTTADVYMAINGDHTRDISYAESSLGTIRSIESALHGFDHDLVEYERRLEKAKKFYAESESKVKAKFEGDADIAALKKQVDDLAAELAKPAEEAPVDINLASLTSSKNNATFKGRPFWSGAFDTLDGHIIEVHSYERAEKADFHHSHYFSAKAINLMDERGAAFFWVDDKGNVNTGWRESAARPEIVQAIKAQIEIIRIASMSDMQATLTPAAQSQTAEIEAMLRQIVRHVTGDTASTAFNEGLIPVTSPVGYPAGMVPKAAGLYTPSTSIIKLALTHNADQMVGSAFHESYHHIEDKLQTAQERDLMKRETERMRQTIKGRTAMSDAQVDGLAGFEVRAIAFQIYATDRTANAKDAGKGLHIGVRRWFDRLIELLRKIMNGLNGLGFHTYKDVFTDAYGGRYASRAATPGGIDVASMAQADEASLAALHTAVAGRIKDKFGERFTELRVRLQDRFLRVRHAQDSFGKVATSQDTYKAEELLPGRTGQRLEELEKTKFEPMVKEMQARGISLEEMSDYLYAKHAPERNAEMDRINHPNLEGTGGRDLQGKGSGMSDADAQQIMDDITAAGRLADFQAVEAMVRDIQRGTVDNLVAYGLISQDTADAWADLYQHYAPLQGFDEAFEDEGLNGLSSGLGLDTRAKEVKRAFGRMSKAAGPLPYIMLQAELAIVRGEKNKVGNTFLRFVRSHPDRDRWSVDRPKVKPAIDKRTGLVTMVKDNQWHNDPNAFVTKIDGQIHVIRLEGKEGQQLARALKNMGTEQLNEFLRYMRMITHTMARLATQWNPNFVVPNLVRDLGEAYINMQEQDQARFVKQFTKHLVPAIGGSFQALLDQPGGRYAQAFREYDAAGGRVRFFGLDNTVDVERSIRRQMRQLQGGPVGTALEAGRKLANGFDAVNGSMENATRLAAFMAARDVGMSVPDSARLALNLTVNFTKKGELGPTINALYMFANATMQGGRRTFSALKSKKVRRATYALIGLGALSAMLGYGMGGEDDAGEDYYSKVPPWERDKNLIIMWPKGLGHDGDYIKIPAPFLFAAFKVLGDRLVGVMMGKDKPLESMGAVINAVLSGLSPLGEEGGSVFNLASLAPSVVRPAEHIRTNINWNGKPLYPEREHEKAKPDSEQYFSTTPEYAKKAARGLNKLGGGSPYESSGALDVHPGSIQHVMESLTGGLGKFVSDVVTTADNARKGEFDATKAPVLRRFVGSANSEQADSSRYYAEREEARKSGEAPIKAARRDSARGINEAEADSFLERNTNSIQGDRIFKRADKQMSPLRQRKAQIEAGDSYTDAQRAEVEGIKKQIREIQNEARKQYRELKKDLEKERAGAP